MSYKIAYDDKDIIIRISKNLIDKDMLSSFLDYINFESMRNRSKLTVEHVSELAKEVNQNIWEKLKVNIKES
jgi:hypothetical protein